MAASIYSEIVSNVNNGICRIARDQLDRYIDSEAILPKGRAAQPSPPEWEWCSKSNTCKRELRTRGKVELDQVEFDQICTRRPELKFDRQFPGAQPTNQNKAVALDSSPII